MTQTTQTTSVAQEANAYYDELLKAAGVTAAQYEQFQADLIASKNAFGNRSQCPYLRPQFVGADQWAHVQKIAALVNSAMVKAGKLILESIPFPLRSTLDEVVTLLAHSSHDKGLELTLNIKNDVPDNVIGDPLRLQQVITNLVGNAIKFTESGNIDILVEKRSISSNKVQIEVQIRDTGIGIPERDQSRLFQAFRQADASISRRHGGTGLGLVITQRLVNEMGGDISFHSQPNRGSTFWFHINLDLNPNVLTDGPVTGEAPGSFLLVDQSFFGMSGILPSSPTSTAARRTVRKRLIGPFGWRSRRASFAASVRNCTPSMSSRSSLPISPSSTCLKMPL